MSLILPSILNHSQRPHQPFILFQSSTAQSCLPLLKKVINSGPEKKRVHTLLFCFLHSCSSLVDEGNLFAQGGTVEAFDHTAIIPGYTDHWNDPSDIILAAVKAAPAGPLNVVFDSVDTLASDLESTSKAFKFLHAILTLVKARPNPSTLTLHILHPSPLLPLLLQTSFSPSLTHLTSHPPILLTHISSEYLTPPPPLSTPEKFWGVFIPIRERGYESERLMFGPGGEGGSGGGGGEFVVEILVRGGGEGRRRAVERVLEGWSSTRGGACELNTLDSLKNIFSKKKAIEEAAPDPTQNVSFNLNLTPSQQESRAQVPLPYAHEGRPQDKPSTPAAILYDPDSADDIDDDDPDEDLDI